jgi:hypothetical protein
VLSKAFALVALVASFTSIAWAQSVPPPADPPAGAVDKQAPADRIERPWADGASDQAQKQALALFEDGNRLFESSEHAAALAKYREALKVWDHPAIRYNAAVALINLDQPLGANENLELALRFGNAPFSPDTYQQALTYRKLLRGQLAELKVFCAASGADVALDGTSLFVAPGEATRWLSPGAHQLVARKPGSLTETRSLSLLPGKPAIETLELHEIGSLPTRTVQRWPTWKPWAVVGGGALLALAGVPVLLDARSDLNAYDAQIADKCRAGCAAGTVPQAATDLRDRAHTKNIVAVSLFAVGGAAAVTGIALAILNQPRTVPADEQAHAAVTPLVGPGVVGLSLAFER